MPTFPGATHTFNVQRPGAPVLSGQNYVAGTATIPLSGASVRVKPLLGIQQVLETGIDATGKYLGSTFSGTAIHANDVLLDVVNTNNDGSPVSYTVADVFDNGLYLRMFLHRKAIGG